MTTSEVSIFECLTAQEEASTYPVMRQLRPHINDQDYGNAVQRVKADGGRLIAAQQDGRVVGCSMFRPQYRLVSGPMIYVDDLVTDAACRSAGVGAALLDWIEEEARRSGVALVMLDSGTQRTLAHRFYFRQGYVVKAFNFQKDT